MLLLECQTRETPFFLFPAHQLFLESLLSLSLFLVRESLSDDLQFAHPEKRIMRALTSEMHSINGSPRAFYLVANNN